MTSATMIASHLIPRKINIDSLKCFGLLYLSPFLDNPNICEKIDFKNALSRQKRLKTLELITPIQMESLSKILLSISHPSELLSLSLGVVLIDPEDLFHLRQSLEAFTGLERIRLEFKLLLHSFKYLKFLQDLHLKHLEIRLSVNDKSILISLGKSLKKMKSLQTLNIRVTQSTFLGEKGSFLSFLTQISGLTQLESLTLHVKSDGFSPSKISKLLIALSECTDNLSNLKYIDIDCDAMNFTDEASRIISSLRKKAHQLRALKLNFLGQKLMNNDVRSLTRLIKDASTTLEELNIHEFDFIDKEPLEKLAVVLSKAKFLHSVSFERVSENLDRGALFNMSKAILEKKGIENFTLTLTGTARYGTNNMQRQATLINYTEILKINPYLKKVIIPASFCDRCINASLSSCRWN